MTLTTLDSTMVGKKVQNNEPTTAEHNLLLIDDEVDIVKALRRQFRRHYTTYIANSAAEGYEIMTQVAIQVIISDQRMPGMSGVAFFNQVKNEFPDAIRLLLTGYADIQSVITAINDGNIFRYITKPWHPAELDAIVREAFVKYDLIVENRLLVNKLQEASQFLEKRVAERTAELNNANIQLSSFNEQKDRFMGMVAHDLRGPIGSLQMCTELLRNGALDPAEQSEFIQTIEETARDALHLINDLLDIAAIESGKLVIEPQLVAIDQLIARISHLNHLIGERKGIQLVVQVDPRLLKVHLDPRRIQQVLDNLLSNAFKYSYPGTRVTLRIEGDGQDLLLAVTDQGQGIPPPELDLLFKPFQRTSTHPTGEEFSTGLGLSICKRIVELHHGTIGAESIVGRGTTFTIRLPKSVKQAQG
ncbi:hypothetical protein BH10CHL1_BH10CHL1_30790 [soil metagenome]